MAAAACACSRATISRLLARFRDVGLWALADGRRFNGTHHPRFHAIRTRLSQLIEMHPQQLGWGRSRWSGELLSHQLAREFSSTYHPAHISSVLASLGIRRVVPRMSIARQPWDHREQAFRLFEKFVGLPQGDIVLFADEVDIHLNPKRGPVLARAGHRPTMETPGANTKRYLAGAYNQVTGHLVWVRGKRKASELFIELCEEIASRYRGWGTIHLVVDNYGIHSSKKTNEALEALGGKIVLHFLPGYSPEYNEIEPVWGVLHDAITRCHRHPDIDALCGQVERFLAHIRDHGLDSASLFEDP